MRCVKPARVHKTDGHSNICKGERRPLIDSVENDAADGYLKYSPLLECVIDVGSIGWVRQEDGEPLACGSGGMKRLEEANTTDIGVSNVRCYQRARHW